jgi:hypothetical protein
MSSMLVEEAPIAPEIKASDENNFSDEGDL